MKSDGFATIQWPKPQTYVEAGIASQAVVDFYRKRVTEEDEEDNQVWFAREFERFKANEKKAKENGNKLEIDYGDEMDVQIETNLLKSRELFKKPVVVEVIGAGFDKPPDAAFLTLQFPRRECQPAS